MAEYQQVQTELYGGGKVKRKQEVQKQETSQIVTISPQNQQQQHNREYIYQGTTYSFEIGFRSLTVGSSDNNSNINKRYASWLVKGETVSTKSLKIGFREYYEALDLIRSSQPVVLQPFEKEGRIIDHETNISFQDMVNSLVECGELEVYYSDDSQNRFFLANKLKNVFGNGYFVREYETRTLRMKAQEFYDSFKSWKQQRLLLYECIMYQGKEEQKLICRKGLLKPLTTFLQDGIQWNVLQQISQEVGWQNIHQINMLLSGNNALLPMQYKMHDRIIYQVLGESQVLLINPSYAFGGLYPFPVHHTYDGYSMVDFENPDLEQWPNSTKVCGMEYKLQAGQCLYVPQYWFAHITCLGYEYAALELVIDSTNKLRATDCIPLQVSRLVEHYGAQSAKGNADNVRSVLVDMMKKDYTTRQNYSEVSGYKNIQLWQRIVTEVQKNLGENQFPEFIATMCRGRLYPTDWLNKDFREPLYIKDKTLMIEDSRSEEQKLFPEFFKHINNR